MMAALHDIHGPHAHDRADDIVCLLTDTGAIAQVTPSLARARDDASQLRDRPFSDLLTPVDRPTFEDARGRAATSTDATTCTVELATSTGARTCEVRIEPPASPGGPTIVVVRDVATSREAALLRRVTEAANRTSATSELFRQAAADIGATMGWPNHRVVDDGDGTTATTRSRGSGQVVAVDGTVAIPVAVDGEVTTVLEFPDAGVHQLAPDLAALLRDLGGQLGSVVDRERIRQQLDERTRELERSNGELERFAYIASHDLQEPLRKVVGFGELVQQRYADTLDDSGREYLGYVVDGAQRMQRLIKDLLAYSRAGRARPRMEPVDLGAVATRVVDTLEWQIEEAAADVTLGSLPTVLGDEGQLAEVLTNLLTNALKYASEDGARVAISSRPSEQPGWWEVTVTDDGIGIDPQYAEQVFEVFRRLHGPTEYPGTGIGLAITRRFVEAHGGNIWVTPGADRGSVFHLTLPTLPEETA